MKTKTFFMWRFLLFIQSASPFYRWPQKLAEQVPPWRPQLPGGSQLCLCAHWPLLMRALLLWWRGMWNQWIKWRPYNTWSMETTRAVMFTGAHTWRQDYWRPLQAVLKKNKQKKKKTFFYRPILSVDVTHIYCMPPPLTHLWGSTWSIRLCLM